MQKEQKITLGNLLKNERESQGLHLENISKETRISKSILINLEADNIDDLPQKIYIIGFVKTYARILKISEAECLKYLDQLYQTNSSIILDTEEENVVLSGQKESTNIKGLLLFIVPIFILGTLILYFMSSSKDNAEQTIDPVPEHQEIAPTLSAQLQEHNSTNTIKKEKEKKAENTIVKTAKILVDDAPKVEDKKQKIEAPTVSEEPKLEQKEVEQKKKEIKFSPFPATLYSFNSDNAEQELANIPQDILKATNTNNDMQNLFLRAETGDAWLTYQLDNGKIHKFILKQGKYTFLQAKLLKIFIGNIHAIKVYLNNRLLKISSRSSVKSLIFPQERAKEFKIPLFIFQKNGKVITSQEFLAKQSTVN